MRNRDARPIHPLIARAGRTRLFRRLAPRLLPACDRVVHRLTGGRWMPSRLFLPTVVLTTTGHRSGLPRATTVCAYRYRNGDWLVVASNFGLPRHPSWSTNLLHRPDAVVTWRGRRQPVTARLLSAAEAAAERRRILAVLPVYDDYAGWAGRPLRVFRLHPAAGPVMT
ncbi:nitroreductase family deazaflavin-dependent oxidoreductase [Streptomyces adelaidensis]|uniref:nitroreductase family deazaflavin-dependent oxidoreductase n=1 Tax=Streptomyces adelaidensis TaxID=2796465 RepID=UPI001908FE7E|nr:nitroreductase family deazaflavin-dependent oxidoreductase [Streptomyces adelaidensis]